MDQKKVQKIVEDKTFGMKNKNKSKKVQQYITSVKTQTTQSLSGNKKVRPNEEVKSKKQLQAEKAAELNQLFKPVVDKKVQVAAGVDPKSVVCQYFKAGTCTKGNRCKFSHDITLERKAAKIDFYTDRRDLPEGQEHDTMENWDENKLRDVVEKKHGTSNRTEIICKYFLDAIESRKYGWFWTCPNGGTCMYRHALPPGFVLAAKKKLEPEDEEDKVPLEDLLEEERRSLKTSTPLTLELFLKWKEDKRLAKEKAAAERKEKIKAGKTLMSGREAFEFNPDLVAGDDDLAYEEAELRKNKEETEKEEASMEISEQDQTGPIEGDDDDDAPEEDPQAITTTTTTTTQGRETKPDGGEGEPSVEVDESVFAAEAEEELPEFD